MGLAQIGPFTTAIQTMAAVVGAGILLGSFVMGSIGFLAGHSRQRVESHVLANGYYGGLFAAGFALVDLTLRYGG
jgi:hypothetical protein